MSPCVQLWGLGAGLQVSGPHGSPVQRVTCLLSGLLGGWGALTWPRTSRHTGLIASTHSPGLLAVPLRTGDPSSLGEAETRAGHTSRSSTSCVSV